MENYDSFQGTRGRLPSQRKASIGETQKKRLERHLEIQKSLWGFKNCGNNGSSQPHQPSSDFMPKQLPAALTYSELPGGVTGAEWVPPLLLDHRHLAEGKELGISGSLAASE